MEKRTREKIALVIFALLVAFAAAVLIGYFTTGRSWNVAASFVDDAAGSMDGYTTVVYAGVIEPKPNPSPAEEGDPQGSGNASAAGAAVGDGSSAADDGSVPSGTPDATDGAGDASSPQVVEGAQMPDSANGATASGEGAADADVTSDAAAADAGESAAGAQDEAADPLVIVPSENEPPADAPPVPGDSIGLNILSLLPRPASKVEEGVFISDVRDLYERKGSDVVSIDAANLSLYETPQVVESGGKRIGVFSIDVYHTKALLKQYLRAFEEADVDVVMCLTPRSSYLASYDGIDVVLVTSDAEGASTAGKAVNGTLVVQSPARGAVGAVVLTANNVASAKVVSAL